MVLISMLGLIAGRAQQLYLDLKRGVGELAQDLGLGDDLGGHQIQDQHAQRADVLVHGPVFGHDKDVLLFQNSPGRKGIWDPDGHEHTSTAAGCIRERIRDNLPQNDLYVYIILYK